MELGAEKDSRRAVQLRYHDALRSIDNESTLWRHIWNQTKIDRLVFHLKALIFGVIA